MLKIIISFIAGGMVGVTAMCCFIAASSSDNR